MQKRYASIWFPYLLANWQLRQDAALTHKTFVFAAAVQGRMIVKASSPQANAKGIRANMLIADCKTILPELEVLPWEETREDRLLNALGAWCIRFSPTVAIDPPDGLIIDTTGCSHLWGGEAAYRQDILGKLTHFGYHASVAIAGTIGTAWAVARFTNRGFIVPFQNERSALSPLPPAALRLDTPTLERLFKLGMRQIAAFIDMPPSVLRRRFGHAFLQKLQQALGEAPEFPEPLQQPTPYYQHLPCLEPVRTAKAIKIALEQLLEQVCNRLKKEELGVRTCLFTVFRVDGHQQQLRIGTGKASVNVQHLMKLFEHKLSTIAPALGIELFTLETPFVMPLATIQDALWGTHIAHDTAKLAELLDRIAARIGSNHIKRYLPEEHYWPERAMRLAASADDTSSATWPTNLPRPLHLLKQPIQIEVMVLLPDYPPKQFRFQGRLHQVTKADGPERIEQEWWLQQGHYRDYYYIENETGARYWIFRLGHYENHQPRWFMHGFFA